MQIFGIYDSRVVSELHLERRFSGWAIVRKRATRSWRVRLRSRNCRVRALIWISRRGKERLNVWFCISRWLRRHVDRIAGRKIVHDFLAVIIMSLPLIVHWRLRWRVPGTRSVLVESVHSDIIRVKINWHHKWTAINNDLAGWNERGLLQIHRIKSARVYFMKIDWSDNDGWG